jgi:hypothetical protein
MKFRDLRGVQGMVFEVDDPRREARRWRRALGLPVLRTGPREIVLGGLSFFVVLRLRHGHRLRLRQPAGDAPTLSELHVAVEGLSSRGLEDDSLGGRHASVDANGLRLVIRELTGPPSAAWLPGSGSRRRGGRRSSGRRRAPKR